MSYPGQPVKQRVFLLVAFLLCGAVTLDFVRGALQADQERRSRAREISTSVDARLQQLSPQYTQLIQELDKHPQDPAVIEKVSSEVHRLMKRAKGYTTNLAAGELAFVQAYRLRQMRAYERYGKAYPQP